MWQRFAEMILLEMWLCLRAQQLCPPCKSFGSVNRKAPLLEKWSLWFKNCLMHQVSPNCLDVYIWWAVRFLLWHKCCVPRVYMDLLWQRVGGTRDPWYCGATEHSEGDFFDTEGGQLSIFGTWSIFSDSQHHFSVATSQGCLHRPLCAFPMALPAAVGSCSETAMSCTSICCLVV
jgi:hypothetical protein